MHFLVNGWFWADRGSGSGQYLTHLMARLPLLAPDSRFTVIVPGRAVTSQPEGTPNLRIVNRSLPPLPRRLAKVWWEQIETPRSALHHGADLIFVPYWAPPLWQPCPTVATVHDVVQLILPAYADGVAMKLYIRLVSRAARRCVRLLTVSEASRDDIIRQLAVAPEQIVTVYNGVGSDPEQVSQARVDSVRRRYRLPERYFLYLGGFDMRKNLASTIGAYARYLALGGDPAIRLVIGGRVPSDDSHFSPDPRRIAREAGLDDDAVCFAGWIDELDKGVLFAGAEAFLFPSLYEGFGLPVLEAMAAGCPVITAGSSVPRPQPPRG